MDLVSSKGSQSRYILQLHGEYHNYGNHLSCCKRILTVSIFDIQKKKSFKGFDFVAYTLSNWSHRWQMVTAASNVVCLKSCPPTHTHTHTHTHTYTHTHIHTHTHTHTHTHMHRLIPTPQFVELQFSYISPLTLILSHSIS